MKISIVIPLFNKASYIDRAMRSVLAQTYSDFEVIVVDDGSTDGGANIVESINDERIRLICQENAGVSAARNTGIKAAKGKWVAFLDADDEWMPGKLAMQIQVLQSYPDMVWIAGAFTQYRNNRPIQLEKPFLDKWFEDEYLVKDALLPLSFGRCFWVVTIMIESDVLAEVGGFDESLRIGEEINLWMRIALKHQKILYIRKPLAKYNMLLPNSLIYLAEQQFDPATYSKPALFAMSLVGSVDKRRGSLLAQIAKVHVLRGLKFAIASGKRELAKQLLKDFGWLSLGSLGQVMKIAVRIPVKFVLFVCQIRRGLYKIKGMILNMVTRGS